MTKDPRSFDTLYVEVLATGRNFRLTKDFGYRQSGSTPIITPAEFETDFASIPRFVTIFVPKLGRYTYPAVTHDYLCRIAQTWKERSIGDRIFRKAMADAGVGFLRRGAMWLSVYLAGWFVWTLNFKGRVGKQEEEDKRKAEQAQHQD
jgi:hypothetical protein